MMMNVSYNRGLVDGRNSAKMRNPIHNNWKRNKSNQCIHFDKDYVAGYIECYRNESGIFPYCLTNVEIVKK